MPLTPEQLRHVMDVAQRRDSMPHGERRGLMATEARRLGIAEQTLYAWLKQAGLSQPRRRRSDAGTSALARDEALKVANFKTQARRANGKDMASYELTTEVLRANGEIKAERVCPETGEIRPLSIGSIRRAVRAYGLDQRTLQRPAPHMSLATPHPNHTWQLDASVCVLYYLRNGGLAICEADEFYKNKPENLRKRAQHTLIRYLVTDHYSGAFHVEYYEGAESTRNLADFFIEAIQPRGEPMHGVPFQLVMDPGSANTSGQVKNLLRRLGVRSLVHRPKNPRAKGSVESHHNVWERYFETRLMTHRVTTLEQLRGLSSVARRHINAVRTHSRHGHTRWGLWQTIRQEQLRLAPPRELCFHLLTSVPEPRVVSNALTVSYAIRGYGSNEYSVEHVPGINAGQTVQVALNPYRLPSILIVETDAEGNELHHVCDPLQKNDAGFIVGAPIYGEGFRGIADTPAVLDRKAMDRAAYGVDTKLGVDAARRKREPAFAGLDTIDYLANQVPVSFLPRRGTESEIQAAKFAEAPLSVIELCRRLQAMGIALPDLYARLAALVPHGAPESELPRLQARLTGQIGIVAAGGAAS